MTRAFLLAAGFITFHAAGSALASTIYSNLRDISIPLNLDGVYLDVDTGSTNTAEFAGWDINPFFGGTGVVVSPAFQPARLGTGNKDTFLGLSVGATVDASRLFSTGYGGSDTHLGTQFTDGQEGYLGFRFTKNDATGPFYGWMRVVFTGNTAGAMIKDWAYDDAGGAIVSGRILQSAPSGNVQTVTLSPGSGETFSVGSAITDTGGNTNNLLKTGLGTVILGTTNTYSGGTTVSDGVLRINTDSVLGAAAGGATILNGATLQAGGAFTSNRLFTLGPGGGKIDTNGFSVIFDSTGSVSGSTLTKVGSGTLTINGAQDYLTLNANAGTTIVNTPLGTGDSTVNVTAIVTFGASQNLAGLTLNDGAIAVLESPAPAPEFSDVIPPPFGNAFSPDEDAIGHNVASIPVPEPGCINLLVLGSFGLVWRRRKTRRSSPTLLSREASREL